MFVKGAFHIFRMKDQTGEGYGDSLFKTLVIQFYFYLLVLLSIATVIGLFPCILSLMSAFDKIKDELKILDIGTDNNYYKIIGHVD